MKEKICVVLGCVLYTACTPFMVAGFVWELAVQGFEEGRDWVDDLAGYFRG